MPAAAKRGHTHSFEAGKIMSDSIGAGAAGLLVASIASTFVGSYYAAKGLGKIYKSDDSTSVKTVKVAASAGAAAYVGVEIHKLVQAEGLTKATHALYDSLSRYPAIKDIGLQNFQTGASVLLVYTAAIIAFAVMSNLLASKPKEEKTNAAENAEIADRSPQPE